MCRVVEFRHEVASKVLELELEAEGHKAVLVDFDVLPITISS
jgi:hypothetical protein